MAVDQICVAVVGIMDFALQALLLRPVGQRGLFFVGGWGGGQSDAATATASRWAARIQSPGRRIRLFIEKMVSMICCCCDPAMAAATAAQREPGF
jgi:hypothetical protein